MNKETYRIANKHTLIGIRWKGWLQKTPARKETAETRTHSTVFCPGRVGVGSQKSQDETIRWHDDVVRVDCILYGIATVFQSDCSHKQWPAQRYRIHTLYSYGGYSIWVIIKSSSVYVYSKCIRKRSKAIFFSFRSRFLWLQCFSVVLRSLFSVRFNVFAFHPFFSSVFPWFFFTFFSFFLSFLAFSSTPWLFYYCFHVVLFLSSIIPVYYAYNFATHFHALLAFWFHRLYSFHSVLDANNHISRTYTQTPRVEMGFFLAQPYNTTLMQIADKRFPPETLITQKTTHTHTHSTCKAFHAYCT